MILTEGAGNREDQGQVDFTTSGATAAFHALRLPVLALVLVPLLSRCDMTAGEGAGLGGFFGRFTLVVLAVVVVLAHRRLEMES